MTKRINTQQLILALSLLLVSGLPLSRAQSGGGVYDFGQGRYGERRGDWTPVDWLGVILLVMVIATGLAISIGLCYYVSKRRTAAPTLAPSQLARTKPVYVHKPLVARI